jgi:hypothetical protein
MVSKRKTAKKKKTVTKAARIPIIRQQAVPLGVGLISTIKYTSALKAEFDAGLKDGGVTLDTFKKKDEINYNNVNPQVDQFVQDAAIGLIVTAGGLITYASANSRSTKAFVSLGGASPPNPSDYFYGGVDLQMYSYNPKRIQYLGSKGYQPQQIYLFYNPNSETSEHEVDQWTGKGVVPGTTPGNNDDTRYKSAFDSITDSLAAVVISADPFFNKTRDKLIKAANDWVQASGTTRYICYPLQNYRNLDGVNRPISGKATLYGPTLEAAYRALGQVAANYFTDPNSLPTLVLFPLGNPIDL